jgi:hypothetical protein
MKKLLITAAALALAFPIAANADSVTGTVGAAGDAAAGVTAGSTSASADASMNASGALSALGDSQGGIDAIGKVDANTNIQVVAVTDADLSADAMSQHDSDIKKLQAAIAAQADLKAKLDAQSIDPSKVVAVDTAADGTLVLYTKG